MDTPYAIIQAGGHQMKLSVGQVVTTDRQAMEIGQEMAFDQVLLVRQEEQVQVGQPLVKGARVICEVHAHRRGQKLKVFKYRRRQNYRRTTGFRAALTDLKVTAIAA